MQVDYFKDLLVPVIGGLSIFMLGLEFMSNGIQNLAVSRMRALLVRIAGTQIKGIIAGTLITGVIQSSTAMTVMVVGPSTPVFSPCGRRSASSWAPTSGRRWATG